MKTYLSRRIPVVVVAGLALAMLALGLLAALGVRSLVTGTASASPAAPNPGHEWSQVEGHGIDGSTYWLGTTDGQALELRVNNARALRLEPGAGGSIPNLIGGHGGNSVTPGAVGATIAGGGEPGLANRVTDEFGTVGGGGNNQAGDSAGTAADAGYATIAGGADNTASGSLATIGGGQNNTASWENATVGGGNSNAASGGNATVSGGGNNTASGGHATVGGGYTNRVTDDIGTVAGGGNNLAGDAAGTTSDATCATVGGGWSNTASGQQATVGGGQSNTASGIEATVGGGGGNTASGAVATVGGGWTNTASSASATVPGGELNTAQGDFSLAAGRRAKANHTGAFVWADPNDFDFASTASREFSARATGGVRFVSAIDGTGAPTAGVTLAAGGNAWAGISDRNVKANFTSVDGRDVLERLASIPIETWNLKSQDASIRHMGPMAQDFHAAFGLGESDTSITTVDADGVALAAIQGLYELSQERAARIQALETQNTTLQQRLHNLEARVATLEGTGPHAAVSQASSSGLPAAWLALAGGLALVGLVLAQRRVIGGRR